MVTIKLTEVGRIILKKRQSQNVNNFEIASLAFYSLTLSLLDTKNLVSNSANIALS